MNASRHNQPVFATRTFDILQAGTMIRAAAIFKAPDFVRPATAPTKNAFLRFAGNKAAPNRRIEDLHRKSRKKNK
jgi:hypothetical protein